MSTPTINTRHKAQTLSTSHVRGWAVVVDVDVDRGSQYASKDYRDALTEYGITASMSRRGDCWVSCTTMNGL